MVVTNHTYDVVGPCSRHERDGWWFWTTCKHPQSSICPKKKDKDGTEVVGNIIHCKNHKSRLTVENKMVDVRLSYSDGSLTDITVCLTLQKHGIFKSVSLVSNCLMVLRHLERLF